MTNDQTENKLPLVAIVTPVYNGGKYLAQTMKSVQAQTYPNIVHIVLNNASTDNTGEIIAAGMNGPIKVIAYKNEAVLPLPLNWSKAFSYLPEDAVYARMLCADDLIRPDAIEKCVQLAESDPAIQVVLSQDIFADEVHRSNLPAPRMVYDGVQTSRDILMGRTGWMLWHHFFVRIQPEDRGEHFCVNEWSPDPHVVLRSALRGKFGYIHEPLAYNRFHDDSVTGKELKTRGINNQMVHMAILNAFNAAVFGSDRAGRKACRQALDQYLGIMVRFIVRWQLTGEKERAKALRDALTDHGQHLSAWDYVRHMTAWPINSVRWRMLEAPVGPRIDEASFVSMQSPRLKL